MTAWESPDEGSKLRVGIQENGYLFASDAVAIYMGVRHDSQHGSMVRLDSNGHFQLESYDGQVVTNPTMTLPREFAFALYRAMCQHFGDADESGTIRNLRADLLHERERVDRLINMFSGLASKILDS